MNMKVAVCDDEINLAQITKQKIGQLRENYEIDHTGKQILSNHESSDKIQD